MDSESPNWRSKLSDLLLINVVIAIVLFGGLYISTQVRHWRNQRASDALYQEELGAYSQAAVLKDADDSQFLSKYKGVLAAVQNREKFNDFNSVSLQYMRSSDMADRNLQDCAAALVIYRYPPDQRTKLRMVGQINRCAIDHTPGLP